MCVTDLLLRMDTPERTEDIQRDSSPDVPSLTKRRVRTVETKRLALSMLSADELMQLRQLQSGPGSLTDIPPQGASETPGERRAMVGSAFEAKPAASGSHQEKKPLQAGDDGLANYGEGASCSLLLIVQHATGGRACDAKELSHCYCVAYLLPSAEPFLDQQLLGRTPIHYETASPVWNFPVFSPLLALRSSHLRLEVWSYDYHSKDRFLGMILLTPQDLSLCLTSEPSTSSSSFSIDPIIVERPLTPRPPRKLLMVTRSKDEGVIGCLTVSLRLGPAAADSLEGLPSRRANLVSTIKSSLARGPQASSFAAHEMPASLQAHFADTSACSPASLFGLAPVANPGFVDEGPAQYLFSLRVVFHGAENLRAMRRANPYVLAFLVSPPSQPHPQPHQSQQRNRVLVFRSAVFSRSLNPVWEASLVLPVVRSTDFIEWEVRSWLRGAGDPFLGLGSLHFPPSPPIPSQARVPFPLRPRPEDAQGDVSGVMRVSYDTAEALLDRSAAFSHEFFSSPEGDEASLAAVPDFQQHRSDCGVSLPNFRDVGGWPVRLIDRQTGLEKRGRMRERLLFRTSGISRATERDSQIIVGELRVKTLIDLRTPDFAGNRGPFLTQFFDVLQPVTSGILLKSKRAAYAPSSAAISVSERDQEDTILASTIQMNSTSSSSAQPVGDLDSSDAFDTLPFDFNAEDAACVNARIDWGHLYLCSLVGRRFKLATIRKSKKRVLLTAGLLAKSPQEQRRIICGPIFDRPDGLTVLYEMFVEHSKAEFLQLFNLLHQLDDASYPVAFFCNHGKDRTGLTAAFIHSICGVDRETIVTNYALSEHFLKPIQAIVDYEMIDGGLTPDIMSKTPSTALRSTLEYLDRKYHGVAGYLKSIGFSYSKQDALRARYIIFD